ncbi:MAG: hypothetical protein ABI647_03105 [Gemmatimonadota bacterium]
MVLRFGLGRVALLSVIAVPLWAQQEPSPQRAFDLERRGNYQAAAEAYRAVLKPKPNDLGALLGLERSLQALGKVSDMTDALARAFASGERSVGLYSVAVRVWTAARMADSVKAAIEKWIQLEPNSEAPYQEWGSAALAIRDKEQAQAAYTMGRLRLKNPQALAGEVAQLATMDGNYADAVKEWLVAVAKTPSYRSAAVSLLAQVRGEGRAAVLRHLGDAGQPTAERIGAILTIRWGDPVGGARRIERALPGLGSGGTEALQEVLDELRGLTTKDGFLARGITLELLGGRVQAQASRFWLEAAQAYAEAGEQPSARRMLAKLAGDPNSSPGIAASATSTLVGVLVSEGKMNEADKQFGELKGVLAPEERAQLGIKLAEGWIRAGKLDRAEQAVANDSTVEAFAVKGRIKLYQGDITAAAELLRAAGPYAGERDMSTARASVLALLQVLTEDSLPALGAALWKLEQRDTAAAAHELEAAARKLEPDKGGAEAFLLAGRLHLQLKQLSEAERILKEVAAAKVPASAAQAELELARLYVQRGDKAPAIELLEHLLVSYPVSAVTPQARRLLDVAKGAIPPS